MIYINSIAKGASVFALIVYVGLYFSGDLETTTIRDIADPLIVFISAIGIGFMSVSFYKSEKRKEKE